MAGREGGCRAVSGLIGKLRTELHGSEQHAHELEGELAASIAHRKMLEERLHALEAAAKHVGHHHVVPRAGISHGFDYAWHKPIDAATAHELRRAGVTFVLRYLGPTPGEGKALSKSEAQVLSAAGIDVAAIFETDGQTTGGFERGAQDARHAREWARGIVPEGRPIYLTADYDAAGEGRIAEVIDYGQGGASVLGHHGTGMYGGLATIEACWRAHACAYLFQTLGWSGTPTVWSPHAQLRQTRNGRMVAGIEVDLDEARAADFGQWRI